VPVAHRAGRPTRIEESRRTTGLVKRQGRSCERNHGHSAVITGAQLTASGTLALNIQGVATHEHTVDLTASDVNAIAGYQRVSKTSSTRDGHAHTVTFN
jgi:hypothetical protein